MNEKEIQITTKLCVKNFIILFCFVMYPQQYKLFYIHNWVLGLIAFGMMRVGSHCVGLVRHPNKLKFNTRFKWQKMIDS